MPKLYQLLTVLFFATMGSTSMAQNIIKPTFKKYQRCYTAERMTEFRNTHPNAETDAQFESWLGQKILNRKATAQRPTANYIIPVVFHIIHNNNAVGTYPNLAASQITQQLLQLNKDFANASNSPYASAANTGIQFVLAQNDPVVGTLLSEPGIDRIDRNLKGWTDYNTNGWNNSYVDGTVKPASIWDANRYFNVWVIPSLNDGTTDLLGYSTFPSSSTLAGLNNNENATTAGVVILTATVGSTIFPLYFGPTNRCTNPFGLGKTLTHEAGHFFGLRHIWGDNICGNDFCNDTPTHLTSNDGIPPHPKSNSCGTADEMFENYMDYSDDIALNTFTADQVDRMQTVMLNSPRRLSLTTSNVGGSPVTGSNKISFIYCSLARLNFSEGGLNNSYPRYRDISLNLNVEDKATGNATVNVTASGTAINGTHYQLLTPTINFVAGDNFKPVKVRIFDNSKVDGERTIILSYSISGTGVAIGTAPQSVNIDIIDDDNMKVGENIINLLDEHFENPTGSFGFPAGWNLLTTPGYVNPFVASINGDAGGTGLCAHITNDITNKPNSYTKGAGGAAVLQTTAIDASSVASLGNLSFKYKTSGLDDNDYAVLYYAPTTNQLGFKPFGRVSGLNGYGPYSSNSGVISNTPSITGPDFPMSNKFKLDFYWNTNDLTNGSDPGFNVDDILFTATPYPVETSVNNSYTFDLQSGAGVHNFKSTNRKAIATITNPSQNLTAVTAQVTQAGTGTVPITTSTGSFLRTQKVIQISPSVANSTATYQGTLYFTTAELAVWGINRLSLKILKVKDGVALNSLLNSGNAELITPVVSEDIAGGYISYTGSFTGFSQFMLVSPLTSLPVSLISFQATAQQKNIELVWSTSQETNNRGFIIERSLDASNYKQVGWVNGNGTTPLTSTYSFIDNYVQPNVTYYYRLRQVDFDNRQVYSQVRNARLKPGAGISIAVSPNPARDHINLFITGTTNTATIEMINLSGQKILQRNEVNAFNGVYNFTTNGIAKGVYTMVVYLPEGAFTKKIIVQ